MKARCGQEDCGHTIERLVKALERLERVTGKLSVEDFTDRVDNGQIVGLMQAGDDARDAIKEAK